MPKKYNCVMADPPWDIESMGLYLPLAVLLDQAEARPWQLSQERKRDHIIWHTR